MLSYLGPPTEYSTDQLMAYVDDEFATSISSWSTKLKQISLNKWQKQAVRLALGKRFQLIQGPPGKLLTIVTISLTQQLTANWRGKVYKN